MNGFVGQWPGELGDRPALWIRPAPSRGPAGKRSPALKTVSNSRPLVTSPVLLAIRPELKAALSQQNWSTLLPRCRTTAGLDRLNLPGWGSLKLSLPLGSNADATYLAAEAVAAASAPPSARPPPGSTVQSLLAGQPKLADTNAGTAHGRAHQRRRSGSPPQCTP